MSKALFFNMRAEEMASYYPADFSKKEASKVGAELTKKVFDDGNINPMDYVANLVRLEAVISAAMVEARNKIKDVEKCTVMGVEFVPVNGGETLNYKEDPIYSQMESELKARVELLKLAQKQEVIDLYGNVVPKVSTTPRKSSITIKF